MKLKTYLESWSKKAYLKNLPKKRMGVGCLLFNDKSQMLILKPTYRDNWLLPGGVIEKDESPRQACIREVKEETNLDIQPSKLLCVDYVSIEKSDRTFKIESVQFVFLGGTISSIDKIKLPKQEISRYQILEPETAIQTLGIHSQRRLKSCLPYFNTQKTLYLENGVLTHNL